MKKFSSRMYRAILFTLGIMPIAATVYRFLLDHVIFGAVWFFFQTALMALLTLFPAFLGNYREYEVVRYEGAKGSDPNPDREAVHTLVKEGHRFPLRMTADILLLIVMFVSAFLLPGEYFIGESLIRKFFFAVFSTLMLLLAAHDLPSSVFAWEDIPGMILGILGYFCMALFLHFSKKDISDLKALISLCAVMYLFFGAVALNRQSVVISMSAHSGDDRKLPKLILLKNRRIVLSFATLVTIVSLVGPIKTAILWFFSKIGDVVRWVRALFGHEPSQNVPFPSATMMQPMAAETEQVVETVSQAADESYLIIYIFFGFIGLSLLWLIYEGIKKLSKKLSKWMEQFAHNVGEGFYDEKEELMTAEEMRDRLKGSIKSGLESLFKREKPWKELDGRERARRLMKMYYKKRAGKVNNLRAKTAREVLAESKVSDKNQKLFSEAYETARYSEHEVSAESMEELKKDLRL